MKYLVFALGLWASSATASSQVPRVCGYLVHNDPRGAISLGHPQVRKFHDRVVNMTDPLIVRTAVVRPRYGHKYYVVFDQEQVVSAKPGTRLHSLEFSLRSGQPYVPPGGFASWSITKRERVTSGISMVTLTYHNQMRTPRAVYVIVEGGEVSTAALHVPWLMRVLSGHRPDHGSSFQVLSEGEFDSALAYDVLSWRFQAEDWDALD